jgi:hypothetical protein
MEHSPSWADESGSVCQDIPLSYGTQRFNQEPTVGLCPQPQESNSNPSTNILILYSILYLGSPFRPSGPKFVGISHLSNACNIPRPLMTLIIVVEDYSAN